MILLQRVEDENGVATYYADTDPLVAGQTVGELLEMDHVRRIDCLKVGDSIDAEGEIAQLWHVLA